jgi:hypothetical protein
MASLEQLVSIVWSSVLCRLVSNYGCSRCSLARIAKSPGQKVYRQIMHFRNVFYSTIQASKPKQTWHQRQRRKKRGHRLVESIRTRCRTIH